MGSWTARLSEGIRAGPRQPVGTIPLVPLADASGPTGLIEIGWHLHPRYQGQGLATEAAGAILAAAAQPDGLSRPSRSRSGKYRSSGRKSRL